MDWEGCDITEIIQGKVSGAPLLIGTRIPADAVVVNYDSALRQGMTADEALIEVSENYPSAGIGRIKTLLNYYHSHQPQPQS